MKKVVTRTSIHARALACMFCPFFFLYFHLHQTEKLENTKNASRFGHSVAICVSSYSSTGNMTGLCLKCSMGDRSGDYAGQDSHQTSCRTYLVSRALCGRIIFSGSVYLLLVAGKAIERIQKSSRYSWHCSAFPFI